MIIVTGGAGFIGSALVWALNARWREDILVVDVIDHDEKEHNLAPLRYEQLMGGDEFREKLKKGAFDTQNIEAILHLGAISATTEKSWGKLQDNNVDFSQEVIRWCADKGVRCVYASSGATYGDGSKGYRDDHALFDKLTPLNLYGKSKLVVDIWARDAGYLDQVVGLRYMNVFGPNEYHKETMRSVIAKAFPKLRDEGVIELFKSYNPAYKDGEQKRDFLYVKDAVDMTLFFLDNPRAAGVFNIGTGQARTWNDVASAMTAAVQKKPNIQYIDMPEDVRAHYQYFTQADISKLREAGYKKELMTLEDAIIDYVQNYLKPHNHLGET